MADLTPPLPGSAPIPRDGPFMVRPNGSYVLTTRTTFHPGTIPAHARFVELVKAIHADPNSGAGVATLIASLVVIALEGGQLGLGQPGLSPALEPEPELDLSGLGAEL